VTPRSAVFLDRDGTIIRDADYVKVPADVELLPGAARAIARLNARGLPVIVVTNQSGIARGLLTQADYDAVRRRLDDLLAADGARVDATYVCPHHPDYGGACDCRKPGTLLYRQAAAAHAIDLSRSTFVGDRWGEGGPGATSPQAWSSAAEASSSPGQRRPPTTADGRWRTPRWSNPSRKP
jgi:D-glycero-D-manno-heptose 1,7-bisphosphate phosphatase